MSSSPSACGSDKGEETRFHLFDGPVPMARGLRAGRGIGETAVANWWMGAPIVTVLSAVCTLIAARKLKETPQFVMRREAARARTKGRTEEAHELARETGVDLTEQSTPLAAAMRSPSTGPLWPVVHRDDPGAAAQLRDDHRALQPRTLRPHRSLCGLGVRPRFLTSSAAAAANQPRQDCRSDALAAARPYRAVGREKN